MSNWRLRLAHRTWFDYAGQVASSYNEARMSPLNEARQTVLDARIDIQPAARVYRYEDYWGTLVTSFDLQLPHESLVVAAHAVVETHDDNDFSDVRPEWRDVGNLDRWHEYLLDRKSVV